MIYIFNKRCSLGILTAEPRPQSRGDQPYCTPELLGGDASPTPCATGFLGSTSLQPWARRRECITVEDERQWDIVCIIQRNTAIDDTEASLRLAITAVAADATREITAADASRALRSIHGV